METGAQRDEAPSLTVRGARETPIAVFTAGVAASAPPLVLVHGTGGDHTVWRTVAPFLARRGLVHAIDRRGRGASGDAAGYSIDDEFGDLAAVVETLASGRPRSVDVVGHSYGGRIALGAALRTPPIRRLIVYEGAPAAPGTSYRDPTVEDDLRALLDHGDDDEVWATFLRRVVGMPEPEIDAYRDQPTWPRRAAAAPTVVRELAAEASASASLEALGAVAVPVLQILGGESVATFAQATRSLDERLAAGRVVVVPGARHAAHHTHPDAFVRAVIEFLDG